MIELQAAEATPWASVVFAGLLFLVALVCAYKAVHDLRGRRQGVPGGVQPTEPWPRTKPAPTGPRPPPDTYANLKPWPPPVHECGNGWPVADLKKFRAACVQLCKARADAQDKCGREAAEGGCTASANRWSAWAAEARAIAREISHLEIVDPVTPEMQIYTVLHSSTIPRGSIVLSTEYYQAAVAAGHLPAGAPRATMEVSGG